MSEQNPDRDDDVQAQTEEQKAQQLENRMVRSLLKHGFPAKVGRRTFTSTSISDSKQMQALSERLRDNDFATNFIDNARVMAFSGDVCAEDAFWFAARSFVVRRQRVVAICAPHFVRNPEPWFGSQDVAEANVLAVWGVTAGDDKIDGCWSGEWMEELEFFLRRMSHHGKALLLHGGRALGDSDRISNELTSYLQARMDYNPTIR